MPPYRRPTPQQGFTLIELMIAVAIVALLSLAAAPGFQAYVRAGHRAEGMVQLTRIAHQLERFYADRNTYQGFNAATLPMTTAGGHYRIALTIGSATAFTLTATAQNNQVHDRKQGVSCATLTLDATGAATPAACWR